MSLSKSKIKQFMQCKKALWLQLNKPELIKHSKESLSKFKNGNLIGELAQNMYPDGLLVNNRKNADKLIKTKEFLEQKKVIYEATFEYRDTICQVDVLRPYYEDGIFKGWDIIEVKAGTSAKDEYIEDIAIQYYIITSSGSIPIHKFYIWHINKNAKDASNIFLEEEIEEKLIPYLGKYEDVFTKALECSNEKEMPICSIGKHCDAPYECAFKDYCWKHIPKNKDTIFDLPKFTRLWKAYDDKIIELSAENKEKLLKHNANEKILNCFIENKDYIDKDLINKFIKNLVFPISALDFESMQYIIPPFKNVTPYQQVPFQFSLEVLNEDGSINNINFLHQDNTDPRYNFVKELTESIPSKGSILTYNMTFEKSILYKLGELYPEYSSQLKSISARMVDLYPVLEQGYYNKNFKNSFSLKSIVKGLFGNDLGYDQLTVQNGQDAQVAFAQLVEETDIIKRIDLNNKMIEYCQKDVTSLFLILTFLKRRVNE